MIAEWNPPEPCPGIHGIHTGDWGDLGTRIRVAADLAVALHLRHLADLPDADRAEPARPARSEEEGQ